MAIVDDVTVSPSAAAAAAPQGQHMALAEKAFEAVIIETNAESVTDQTRRHRVKHLAQHEATAGRDDHRRLVIIGGALWWQRAQMGAF